MICRRLDKDANVAFDQELRKQIVLEFDFCNEANNLRVVRLTPPALCVLWLPG